MSNDLNALSLQELKALRSDVDKAILNFEKRKKAEAVQALQATAKELGFSLADLVAEAGHPKKEKVPARYANPGNPDETWSGRGRQPAWYKAEIAAGREPADLEI
ncbi:H-NS histone family protein [Falsirhodobacter xinxiangensis]|uniref:H-NS histone family protein n=1 Tax=Falsirhodobacter xinxiangensis TaxID=2530049 RepID=UPI0010AB14EE|nr:H-NS histone family protein [Rhodobacter xinxiangensis]